MSDKILYIARPEFREELLDFIDRAEDGWKTPNHNEVNPMNEIIEGLQKCDHAPDEVRWVTSHNLRFTISWDKFVNLFEESILNHGYEVIAEMFKFVGDDWIVQYKNGEWILKGGTK
jgi:hypothetical protein